MSTTRSYAKRLIRALEAVEIRQMKDVYDTFICEEIDAGQAKRMLILMEPVLRARLNETFPLRVPPTCR